MSKFKSALIITAIVLASLLALVLTFLVIEAVIFHLIKLIFAVFVILLPYST